jgi:predicted O-methyltransferase YrrM
LVASKPKGTFLELGTGTGISLSWMVAGMDRLSRITTIDNDEACLQTAQHYFRNDPRITFTCADGDQWIRAHKNGAYDLIFADAWPGKYHLLGETLHMVKPGGYYVVDDLAPQQNWPQGHGIWVGKLLQKLESRSDFHITKLNWSTGLLLAVRKSFEA